MFASFVAVWSELVTWVTGLFQSIESLFVTTGAGGTTELTFVGICAIVTCGISLMLLVFNLIRSFVVMRG